MATLIPTAGTAAVEIGPALGVRVAGVPWHETVKKRSSFSDFRISQIFPNFRCLFCVNQHFHCHDLPRIPSLTRNSLQNWTGDAASRAEPLQELVVVEPGGDPKNPGLLSDVPWHRDRDHGVEVFGWKNGGFLAGFAQIW